MAYNFAKTEVGFSHEIDSHFTYPHAFLVSSYCIIHDFQFGLMSLKCKIVLQNSLAGQLFNKRYFTAKYMHQSQGRD